MSAAKKKTMLVVGGSYADIPMIDAAKALGFTVYTSGNRPDELGHRHGDGYYPADYSDRMQVLDVARRLNVDALCPSCNDFSALSCAYVAEELNLPGQDPPAVATMLHHKDKFRKFALKNGLRAPRAVSFGSAPSKLSGLAFPVIVKPVDLTGGKGVSKVEHPEQLKRAVSHAFSISRQKRIVVEEFVDGSRHAITAFIVDRRVRFSLTDCELYFLNPYLVSGAYAPGNISTETEQALCRDIERIAGLLNLVDGIVHVQFILTEQGPVIIEICRRPPGDLYVKLVSYVTGIDYPQWLVMGFAGLDPDIAPAPQKKAPILRHCVMADRPGTVKGIYICPSVKENVFDQMLWDDGMRINDHLTEKVGIMFLRFGSPAELAAKSREMHKLIYPIMAD